MDYSYEIQPCRAKLGLGWELRLLKDGAELNKMLFPISDIADDVGADLQTAYLAAIYEAKDWLRSTKALKTRKASPLFILAAVFLPMLMVAGFVIMIISGLSELYEVGLR